MAKITDFLEKYADHDIPAWLGAFVAVARPLAVTNLICIPAFGAASVGVVSGFNEQAGLAMAKNSAAFMHGLPGELYWLIGSVSLGYFGAKTAEAIKKPAPPAGAPSPEEYAEDPRPATMPGSDDPSFFARPAPKPSR